MGGWPLSPQHHLSHLSDHWISVEASSRKCTLHFRPLEGGEGHDGSASNLWFSGIGSLQQHRQGPLVADGTESGHRGLTYDCLTMDRAGFNQPRHGRRVSDLPEGGYRSFDHSGRRVAAGFPDRPECAGSERPQHLNGFSTHVLVAVFGDQLRQRLDGGIAKPGRRGHGEPSDLGTSVPQVRNRVALHELFKDFATGSHDTQVRALVLWQPVN